LLCYQLPQWSSVRVLVHDVAGNRSVAEVILSEPLQVDRLASGIGGIDVGAVAPNTMYDVRLGTRRDGTAPGLLATLTGTAPTWPADYVWWSEPLWGQPTSAASAWMDVGDLGGGKQVYLEYPMTVLSNGKAAASTPIDCSRYLPATFTQFWVHWWVRDTNGGACTLSAGTVATEYTPWVLNWPNLPVAAELAGNAIVDRHELTFGDVTPATAMSYQMSGVPSHGLTVEIMGFQIERW
jgi:hypothetical protein